VTNVGGTGGVGGWGR